MMRKLQIALLLIAPLVISSGCRKSAPEKIKVGVIVSNTGVGSAYGIDNTHGLQLAEQVINGQGGIAGKMVEFDIQDSGSDPSTAVLLTRRFAADHDVVAILGPTRTSEAVAVSKLLPSLRVVAISVGSTGDWLSAAGEPFNEWTFRSTRSDSLLIRPLLQSLKTKYHARTLALLFSANDDWSRSIAGVYRSTAQELGLKIVVDENIPSNDPNRTPQLLKVKQAKPDALIVNLLAGDAPGVTSEARQMGIAAKIVGTAGFTNKSTWKLANPGALEGVLLAENYSAASTRPAVQKFLNLYRGRFGVEAPPYSAYAYDGATLLADALKRVHNVRDRSELRDALATTQNFDGVLGSLTYHGSGDAQKPAILLEIHGDGYVPVE